jgi:hypothetical protein
MLVRPTQEWESAEAAAEEATVEAAGTAAEEATVGAAAGGVATDNQS